MVSGAGVSGASAGAAAGSPDADRPVLESPLHTHADSMRLMSMMDAFRAKWGIVYPFEAKDVLRGASFEKGAGTGTGTGVTGTGATGASFSTGTGAGATGANLNATGGQSCRRKLQL